MFARPRGECDQRFAARTGRSQFRWDNKSFRVGASVGVLAVTRERLSPAEVMSLADRACYVAKDAGRNRIHVFREGDVEFARSHGEMVGDALAASKICLEITETAAIMNLSRAMAFMDKLKACGCTFALDDFGSGFPPSPI